MKTEAIPQTIAFLGTHPPRQCGIATFGSDLLGAVASRYPQSPCVAVAVNDVPAGYPYGDSVICQIEEQDLGSYRHAADFLNSCAIDVLSLQHEFGIFGGPAGSHISALLRELQAPVVTTLHTVLQRPNLEQQRVMESLIAYSARLVVMTQRGKSILCDTYQVPASQITVIPHGIPDVSFTSPAGYQHQLGLAGRPVLLTFGLLSPNKGIEYVLEALPEIVAEFPQAVYVVLGATHPNELRSRGEAYRDTLAAIVQRHGLGHNVIFVNRFVTLAELTQFLGAADIYITPYLDEAQISSGTLAYAFGAGKAVVSTPYWHAAELLSDDRGVLVPFASSPALTRAVTSLLENSERRNAISAQAYQLGRSMVWRETACLYKQTFVAAQAELQARKRPPGLARWRSAIPQGAPPLNLAHLYQMTDTVGILQHACHTEPNLLEGYCTDDNARALILAVLLEQTEAAPQQLRSLGQTYESFLLGAFDDVSGRFHNFRAIDRRWVDQQGSEDSHGRAIWALGVVTRYAPAWSNSRLARQLFVNAIPVLSDFTSPRAWAFSLIGIHEYLQGTTENRLVRQAAAELTRRLTAVFDSTAQPDWLWFESELSYDNAKLAHALILSGATSGQPRVADRGVTALRWLMQVQTARQGWFRPIGSNGFFRRHSSRSDFDQQPIEAHSTVSACLEAFRATGNPIWFDEAQRAFDWFHGHNDLGVPLYCRETGGCRDALHADRENENQGAESTLAYLLSLAEMRLAQKALASPRQLRYAAPAAQ